MQRLFLKCASLFRIGVTYRLAIVVTVPRTLSPLSRERERERVLRKSFTHSATLGKGCLQQGDKTCPYPSQHRIPACTVGRYDDSPPVVGRRLGLGNSSGETDLCKATPDPPAEEILIATG